MFASVDMELPLPTRVVIGAVAAADRVLVGFHRRPVGFVVFAVKRYYATPMAGKRRSTR